MGLCVYSYNYDIIMGGVLGVRPAIVKQSRGMRHKVLVHGAGMKLATQSMGFQGLAPDAALFLPFDKVLLCKLMASLCTQTALYLVHACDCEQSARLLSKP